MSYPQESATFGTCGQTPPSATIGRHFVTGGGTAVTGHVTLADNVRLPGRAAVTNDVKEAGCYGGYPLQSLKRAIKTLVSIGQLDELRRNLQRVVKQLRSDNSIQ